MKKPTLCETYTAGLLSLGYKPGITTSRKYHLFSKEGAAPTHFWLGSHGAVRFASIRRIDASVSASESTRSKLLHFGQEYLAECERQAEESARMAIAMRHVEEVSRDKPPHPATYGIKQTTPEN